MGSGYWLASTYHDRARLRARDGKDAFDYSGGAIRSGDLRPHQTLDPNGLLMRESRDSAEHRDSNAIMIGDETAYTSVKPQEVSRIIGDGMQTGVALRGIVEEVKQRYHLYFLIPGGASHGGDKQVTDFWKNHVGEQNVLHLENPEDTS